jgi:hypothetical protein
MAVKDEAQTDGNIEESNPSDFVVVLLVFPCPVAAVGILRIKMQRPKKRPFDFEHAPEEQYAVGPQSGAPVI